MSIGTLLWQRDILIAAAALIVALGLLWLYLRAVRRSMRRHSASSSGAEPQRSVAPAEPPLRPLEITTTEAPPYRAVRAVWRGPMRAAAVQLVAGLIYALGVGAAWMYLAAEMAGWPHIPWYGVLNIALFFAWPIVIVVGLVATVSWRAMAAIAVVYLGLLIADTALWMPGTPFTFQTLAAQWWQINGPATLIALMFLARPIRAMGPIVVALIVAAAAGLFGIAAFLDPNKIEWIGDVAVGLGLHTGVGIYITSFIVFAVPALAAALLGYFALRVLGRLYRAQWVSDQSIQADAVWLTFAVLQSPAQLPYAGLASFFIYKVVASAANRLLRPAAVSDAAAPRLLLLRVFSLGARSGRLFDAFARLWRYIGSVRMIAGPDLANATVEPHEFLDFLAGRLQRRFITGPDVLDRRLAETVPRRDPDGRFRVSSFFCHEDTWRMVLRRLARDSDVVLMDLRGFTRANQGCVYELHELLDAVSLERCLFVVDATTDEAFLAEVLKQGWTGLSAASPNRNDGAPRVRLYCLDTGEGSVGKLVATLVRAHERTAPRAN